MSKAVIRRSERIYAFLLKSYPKSYRNEFEEEMRYVFAESLKDAYSENGIRGIIELWAKTVIDAGESVVIQHMESQKGTDSMKTKNTDLLMQNKVIIWLAVATGLILLAPLIAMQFSSGVKWSLLDFVTAGALLFGTGLMSVLVARKMSNVAYRTAVGVAAAAGLLLAWVNAAVGIIGDEDLANLMYIGVIAVGIIGAFIARFKPHGMARALLATALAQALVAMVALIFYSSAEPGPVGILALNGFFFALWIGSALLFRRASVTDSKWERPIK